jgi:hypothetical protein
VLFRSRRVNGTGPCRILEVSYHDEDVKEEDKSVEIAATNQAIQAVHDKLARVESSLTVHRGSLQLVDACVYGVSVGMSFRPLQQRSWCQLCGGNHQGSVPGNRVATYVEKGGKDETRERGVDG